MWCRGWSPHRTYVFCRRWGPLVRAACRPVPVCSWTCLLRVDERLSGGCFQLHNFRSYSSPFILNCDLLHDEHMAQQALPVAPASHEGSALAAPLPTQLPANGLGRQQTMDLVLGPQQPHGRAESSSWPLAAGWPSSGSSSWPRGTPGRPGSPSLDKYLEKV